MRYSHFAKMAICPFLFMIFAIDAYAALPIDLHRHPEFLFQTLKQTPSTIKENGRKSDFNQTQHIRIQQWYEGYPVRGADAIIHVPSGRSLQPGFKEVSMNGIIYQNLEQDLAYKPTYILDAPQKNKAIQLVSTLYQKTAGQLIQISDMEVSSIVYVDQENKAHWAYQFSFNAARNRSLVAKPIYILDAITLDVLRQWNNLPSETVAKGGGYGGNKKMGRHVYDGLAGDLPQFDILRDDKRSQCYLANTEVTVIDARTKMIAQFPCGKKNREHHDLYWDADFDSINGGFSPGNDALRIGKTVKDMYQQWYGSPVLVDHQGKPIMLTMLVHENMENAYWDGKQMIFGDGGLHFYPLVSLGVGAHEIAHGVTMQNSNLDYFGQSGGLNESFSDMAGEAAQYFLTGHNSWHLGEEILKANHVAVRYMDDPTKDCAPGGHPGEHCSIAHFKDYHPDLDVHFSSGLYNKIFYLLSTAKGWNTKKAFDIMYHANTHYWTPSETFESAACGVLWATKDYHYDRDTVLKVFSQVGMHSADC